MAEVEFVYWQFGKDCTWAERPARERIAELLDAGYKIVSTNATAPSNDFRDPGVHITMMVKQDDMDDYEYISVPFIPASLKYTAEKMRLVGYKIHDIMVDDEGYFTYIMRRRREKDGA